MARAPGNRRYIFNTLTVFSLLLTLATLGLWVDSYWYATVVGVHKNKGDVLSVGIIFVEGREITSINGRFHIGESGFVFLFSGDGESGFHAYRNEIEVWSPSWQFGGFYYESTAPIAAGLYIPHWFLTLIFAIGPAIWIIKWRRRRKLGLNVCPSCNYDLTGNETGRCPECGTETKIISSEITPTTVE